MVDEFELRDLARNLAESYKRLGRLRDTRPRPPEVRSALKPAPGPQTPGNGVALYTLIDCETRLRQVGFNAMGDVGVKLRDGDGRAPALCELIALNANAIARLEWAADLMEELQDQDRKLIKAIERIEPHDTGPAVPEKYIDIEAITRNLNERGHQVTNRQARDVAVYNKFDICKMTDGRNGYKLLQFLAHYEKKTP